MTDERLGELTLRVDEMELRLMARMDAVMQAMTTAQGLTIEALSLIAQLDRPMVERSLKARRLTFQAARQLRSPTADLQRIMIEQLEMALEMGASAGDGSAFGPR